MERSEYMEMFDRIINDRCIRWDKLSGSSVLITGGTGLIGSTLTKAILEHNRVFGTDISVTLPVRDQAKAEKIYGNSSSMPEMIVMDLASSRDIPGRYDYIIHGASVTSSQTMVTDPVGTIDLAYTGTKKILELARRSGSKGVVYLSSMEVYGITDSSMNPITEDKLGFVSLSNVRSSYQESKRICELLAYSYYREYGVPVVTARLAQTFGPGVDRSDGRIYSQFAKSIMEGRDIVLHTEGNSVGNYCDIRDTASAILCLLTTGAGGEAYNVVNEANTYTIRDMAQMCAAKLSEGKTGVVFDIPEDNRYGYAPDTKMRLSSAKLSKLGWSPCYTLEDMFRDLISRWENGG